MENYKRRIGPRSTHQSIARPFAGFLVIVCALASLAGCETVRPYSEADAKASSAVRTSFRDAGLDKPFTAERDLVSEQNRRQLAAVRDFTLARRDEALVNVISLDNRDNKDWRAKFETTIDRRMQRLLEVNPSATSEWEKTWGKDADDPGLPNFPDFTAALEPIAAQKRLLEQKSRLYAALKLAGDPKLSCPRGVDAPAIAPVTVSANAQVAANEYVQQCTALLAKDASFRASLAPVKKGSELGKAISEAQNLAAERARAEQEVAKAKKQFDDAVKAYKAALAKGPLDDVRAAAAKLQERLDALGKASQAVAKLLPNEAARGELAKLEEQLNAVDGLLDALRAKAEDPAKDKSADSATTEDEATLLKVAATIRELSRAIDAGHHPRTGALLIQQEHLRFMLARARAAVALDDARIALVERRRDAMIEEVNWLLKSRRSVSTIMTLAASPEGNSVRNASPDCRAALQDKDLLGSIPAPAPCTSRVDVRIATALNQYAASWTIARLAEQEAAVQEIGLLHVAVVDASESAFAEWQALLDVPLSQLETYYAGGLRSEDVANLINAVGLGAIAIRVK